MPKNLVQLYQKAYCAEIRVMKANQNEIMCWNHYGKGFEVWIEVPEGANSQTARNQLCKDMIQLPDIIGTIYAKKKEP